MSVSPLAIVQASPKLTAAQLQAPGLVKKRSFSINSRAHSSVELIKGMVINGPLKFPALSNIFPIQFIYLEKLICTKVMKVNHGYDNPFYKVALTTLLHKSASLWWLQLQPNGWATLLGPKLNQKLKRAVTSAIECHELLITI